ncbi:hypothetical protein BDU57DRAFT_515323 [Ampelomyces quisqualis]|uniref:Uncharacterized protein n=1 Tax=Ampelomyces quisqualis TaxID=50730 RepID=A0A6A5QSX0_AMPQU|nr:hypothetical protein BDU57DRAFT_515323 [Ampelomyces quisqualis]
MSARMGARFDVLAKPCDCTRKWCYTIASSPCPRNLATPHCMSGYPQVLFSSRLPLEVFMLVLMLLMFLSASDADIKIEVGQCSEIAAACPNGLGIAAVV